MSASPLRRLSLPACLILVCVAAVAGRQASPAGIMAEYARANAAFEKKDYRAAIEHFTKALAVAPSHPGLLSELARAEFLAGQRRQALDRLTRALALGGGLDVADDAAMAPLLAAHDAGRVREMTAALRAPVSTSQPAFRLAERDLIPEGIAYDPVAGRFYVGSIYRRKIASVDRAGRVSTFVAERQDGVLAVLGMKVDAARRVLWAATEGALNMKDAAPGDDGRAALMKYDLQSGRLLQKYEPAEAGRHLFNDVAIDGGGNLFVTDSEAGSVYRLAAGAQRLERLVGPAVFEYPNGVALASDGRRLFVAHVAGISVIDIATARVMPLADPEAFSLADVDGLYRVGHRLVAVQNGLSPARVVQFALSEDEDRVTGMTILERGHPLFASIPTTGVVVDGWFYYIANAQLRAFTADHRILPLDKLQETVILKTRLPQ